MMNWLEYGDLANLKSDIDKLYVYELEKVPSSLNNLKSKVDNLDVDKMKTLPVDLKKKRAM